MKKTLCGIALIVLASCSENASDLVAKSAPLVIDVNENYQSVYRRLSKQYDCSDGAWVGAYATMQVDRELYSELGFGELALRMSNLGANNYYSYVKVSKRGAGSRVEIYTGNTLAAPRERERIAEIASGKVEPNCDFWAG